MEAKKEKRPLISAEEQARRAKAAEKALASDALEGYGPMTGLAHELQQAWIRGEITIEESIQRLAAHQEAKARGSN